MAATLGVDTIQHTNGTTAVTVGTNGSVTAAGTLGVTGLTSLTTMNTTGNVGIGTASPQELLHLSQTGGSTIRFQNPGARVWTIGNDGTSFVVDDVTGSKETLRIDGTGVVMGGGSLAATRTADLQIHTDVAGGAVSFGDESSVVISTNATGAGSQGYIGSLWFGSQDVSQSSQYGWKMAGMAGYMSGDTSSSGGSADLLFYTASSSQTGTERMRIDSSGKLLIGTTAVLSFASSAPIQVLSSGIAGAFKNTTAGSQTISVYNTGNSGTRYLMWFESNASKTNVGSITSNGSATAYNTSSDYRLKENVDYTWDATTRLKQLKPARFNFISDDTNTLVDGFLAHEVSSIVPEAITGTKDAMRDEEYEVTPAVEEVRDADDNITTEAVEAVMGTRSVPDMQGIDQSKLVPLLIKTIQELEARITALEAE